MKTIAILFAAISLSTMTAAAQNKVGEFSLKPMVGINVSDLSSDKDQYKAKVGFTGGMEAEYGVTPWLGVAVGAVYSQQGVKIDAVIPFVGGVTSGGHKIDSKAQLNGKLKADYINVPLLANYYVWKGLSIKAGIQVGFLTSSYISRTATFVGIEVTDPDNKVEYTDYAHLGINIPELGIERSDICKSVVFGIPVGLSYEYKNITLDARYYFGLTRMDDFGEDAAVHNRCLSITLGYKFKL